MADFGISEGWIAAAGATIGAILLKVAEKLLQQKKERFEQSITVQAQAEDRIKTLWTRIDALQTERDTLWQRVHTAEEQHDTRAREAEHKYQTLEGKYDRLMEQYRELRMMLRGRQLPDPPEDLSS